MWSRLKFRRECAVIGERITRRQVVLRPTAAGGYMLLMTLATAAAAWNYAVNLVYALAFWLAGSLLVTAWLSVRGVCGTRIKLDLPDEIFAAAPAAVGVNWHGNRTLLRWAAWFSDNEDGVQYHDDNDDKVNVSLTLPKRGLWQLPEMRLATTAPFGLWECSVRCIGDDALTVYPKPLANTPQLTGRFDDDADGLSRQAGGSEVAYLKPFADGLPMHTVAWKHYAKTGTLSAKHFEQPSAAEPALISFRDYPNLADRDALAGLLCHRVLAGAAAGRAFVLELPQQSFYPQNGQRRLCLSALAVWS